MSSVQRKEIRSHHSIRGIAAIFVLILHMTEILAWGEIEVGSKLSFIGKGYLWVDCFFILSGFVLSYAYARTLHQPSLYEFGRATVRFFRARFARIYPLHIFALILLLSIRGSSYLIFPQTGDFFRGENNLYSLATNMFLIHSWELNTNNTWNTPSWSISTETFAYLLFPLLCLAQYLVKPFYNTVLFLLPILFYAALLYLENGLTQTYHLALMRCTAGFLLGMVTHNLWKRANDNLLDVLGRFQLLFVAVIFATMQFLFNDIIAVIAFFLLILTTASDKGILAKMLCHPLFVHLGMVSYSVYMMHYVVMRFAFQYKWFLFDYWVMNGVDKQLLSITIFSAIILVVLGVSEVTYRYVEVPARNHLQKRK